MKSDIIWYNDDETILYFKFYPGEHWQKLFDFIAIAQQMTATKPHRVDWIVEIMRGKGMPDGNLWDGLKVADQNFPDNMGLMYFIQPDLFIQVIHRIGEQMTPEVSRLIHHVESIQVALEQIRKIRRDLE